MKSMIFAAGLGTRLKPLTDTMPKAMVPVGGIPLIHRTLQRLIVAGATEIIINVHHFANQIVDYVSQLHYDGVRISISDESEELLDTGGGLLHAAPLFSADNSPVLIHNVDILSNADLRGFYSISLKNDATLLVSQRKTKRYLLFDNDMRLKGWTNIETGEVKSPFQNLNMDELHHYAFSGIHCFSPTLFSQMQTFGKKFPIIDFYLTACANANIRGSFQPNLRLLDVGKLDSLSQAEAWVRNEL